MARVRVETVLTTTQPVRAYGGIRLGHKILADLAEGALSGAIPLTWNHDRRLPMNATVVDAGVRGRPDGFSEAWATLDVDEDEWSAFETSRAQLGAPGGMSFTMVTRSEEIRGPAPAMTTEWLSIAGDAAHFEDDVVYESAVLLGRLGRISPGRLYQFAQEPAARVLLEFVVTMFQAVPPSLLANYLYDGLRPFLRVPSRMGRTTTFEFVVSETSRSRRIESHLETSSEAVAREAISAFIDLAGRPGRFEYVEGAGWRELPSVDSDGPTPGVGA